MHQDMQPSTHELREAVNAAAELLATGSSIGEDEPNRRAMANTLHRLGARLWPRCALCGYAIQPDRIRPLFAIDEDTGQMPRVPDLGACSHCHNVVPAHVAPRARRNGWTI